MRTLLLAAGVLAFAAAPASAWAKTPAPPAAAEAAKLPDWHIEDLYASGGAWKAQYDKTKAEAATLDRFKGQLGKSAADLLAALDAMSAVRKDAERLYVYASLTADEDVRVAATQERKQAGAALLTLLGEKTAWVQPEILAIGDKTVQGFLAQSPELSRRFAFFLGDTLRAAPHTLGTEAEGVLAAAGNVINQPNNIYDQLASGDLPFPTITFSDGTKVRLDQSAYTKYRSSPNRADRKKLFDTFWSSFKKYEGTFGQTLTTQVLGEVFDAKVRHYDSALAAALFQSNLPVGVYRQLVAQANAGLPTMYRYLKMRKELLGIKGDMAYYDVYPPMFKLAKPLHFDVPQSEAIGLAVTAAYGGEYTALLKKGFAGKWMDVYPRPGKTPGAYMNGSAYGVHPYLHLNHNDDYESLSTFVHEWGHAVHTLLSGAAQPYELSDYSTFVAETASISNELLLGDYMAAHAANDNEKLYYLDAQLELIRGTFFRQTMFAEFQLAIHDEIEKGNTLSGARMTELYCNLLRRYHGEAQGVMKIDPEYCVEWAYIPHFYYGFYVYQYATSMVGAAEFTKAIENNEPGVRDRYIDMLKAGGSDYPYELYKKAGIDMASPEPYQALLARMNRVMDEIDALRAKAPPPEKKRRH